MVVQVLRFHVECNQTGWVKALPKVHFNIMNTINASTGFTPFMLKSAHLPHLIPPLITLESKAISTDQQPSPPDTPTTMPTSDGEDTAQVVINQLAGDLLDTKDSLTVAKISQVCHANKDCAPDPTFNISN